MMRSPVVYVRDVYDRYERPISSISLVGGFIADALTIKRADTLWENSWVLLHLVIVAICIILINREERKSAAAESPSQAHFWLVNLMQFSFGGLMSTFLVLYFRSATLSASWPFILILAGTFIANERIKHHYARLTLQISLFFLSLFTFAIFIIPVLIHRIGPAVFLLSGAVSLGVLGLFLAALKRITRERFYKSRRLLQYSIISIFLGMNFLYFTNAIPPIPLSLRDAGVYHSVSRNAAGNYVVTREKGSWTDFFRPYKRFHLPPGGSVFAYSAIFSPGSLNTDIVYQWQHYNPDTNRWEDRSSITLRLVGGRAEGYRSYAEKNALEPGKWRVNVKTPQGQVIGRILFNVFLIPSTPPLETEVKQ